MTDAASLGARKLYLTNITQSPIEIAGLISVLQREGVRSFLEIGSRYGGSLWKIAKSLPAGSRIVSVDSGAGMGGGKRGAQESLRECVADLRLEGYDAHLIVGDSQEQDIVDQASLLGPFDAALIDGDHELAGVTKDWENYGPDCKLVAFHDTHWVAPAGYSNPRFVEVPILWQRLKAQYSHEEWHDPEYNFGIGLLYRLGPALPR